ncbi:predicted protein [Botrytis cinerea T4]|uniref:Uncharacterized protein n=1 Tax=Botryotinia fuckeliana (strain T4) TaxID=999810 RepID=G2Y5Y2_BOTF4|nr:predicted protein [Botrytis cinerea T4]
MIPDTKNLLSGYKYQKDDRICCSRSGTIGTCAWFCFGLP